MYIVCVFKKINIAFSILKNGLLDRIGSSSRTLPLERHNLVHHGEIPGILFYASHFGPKVSAYFLILQFFFKHDKQNILKNYIIYLN
jgi:hypothetical protein